jgi:predicted small secreted protein
MDKKVVKKVLLFKAGLIAGWVSYWGVSLLIQKYYKLNSKVILNKVRQHFDKKGTIEACWIEEEHADLLQMDIEIPVFVGGIVRKEDGLIKTYEFTADAKTGTLITVNQIDESEDE